MKRLITFSLLILWFLSTAVFCFRQPRHEDDSRDPLPPATQDGRGTFACYINDKSFIGTPYNCFFQYNPGRGRYFLALTGNDEDYAYKTQYPWSIHIVATSSTWQIPNDTIIPLGHFIDTVDSAEGIAFYTNEHNDSRSARTDSTLTGELHITRFDLENFIVSGTFWFDVLNPYNGDTLHVRDGRFDVRISF